MSSPTAISGRVRQVLSSFKGQPDELIPVLQKIQQKLGYLPEQAMLDTARFLRVPESEVYSAALFYPQFRLKPVGRIHVCVCGGTACHVRGSKRILEKLEKRFGIHAGETSPDLKYSLESIDCIGACGAAPNIIVNGRNYGGLTAGEADRVIPASGRKKRKGHGKK